MPLPYQPPPHPQQHKATLDPFIFWYLKSVIQTDPHYEHQIYGPFNVYLQGIFPPWRRFAVIPQALIRPVVPAEQIDDDLANVSIGSTGGFHKSRKIRGPEINKSYPDFLVVRVKTLPSGARKYHIVSVVEIKVDDTPVPSITNINEQMMRYMRRLADLPHRSRNLIGYLVCKNLVIPYRISHPNGERTIVQLPAFNMFAPGDPFTNRLCAEAVQNWNEI
ncbi:hypothetical protein EV421DRAFT_1859520 [Armillaria borealis]|uniref:Uncharacterized protein n=1 Tax=Armillaria borealis TaxID=47425 RepID=A0AA39MDI2_9AGAR|nr:hypothetical protein EV421DRAFT_1859520 [Armillaria borealis]